MAIRKLLLLMKPFDLTPPRQSEGLSSFTYTRILNYLNRRHKAHQDAINHCQAILQQRPVTWKSIFRDNIPERIQDVDLVIALGGDGTLLEASHVVDDSIPILGVNSDPTQIDEVEKFKDQFDATRSIGHLCGATVSDFEHVLDGILEGQTVPYELTRLSIRLNSQLSVYALNDILVAHTNPAALSRFSFKIGKDGQPCSPLVHCRSSGLRVSTAAGSTAAMFSAGGFQMLITSQDLQYMVREPISPGKFSKFMHGLIKYDQSMDCSWTSKEGAIYIDGSHVRLPLKNGDSIEISSKAPTLKVFLSEKLLSRM